MAQVVRFFLLLLCAAAPCSAAPTGSSYLSGTGRFWHITDLHLDPSYHLAQDPTKVCFSSKGAPAAHAGLYGDFLCDSPYSLILSAFANMAPLTQPEDFIIWTGDSPPHVPPDELSTDLVIQVISNMTQTITQHFPNLTVFPALGNHDYWPQMPDSTNDIYKAAAALWKRWLEPEALTTLSQGGFYSQLVKPGLRLLSLNTILYYGPDKVTSNMTDPAGQFEWLEKTLEKSAQSKEKVYVIAHVPVGYLPFVGNTTAIRGSHNERLVAIFRKYSHVVAGQFYGHTHRDSIMPYSNNPGFRMYLYNNEDYSVMDIWQYYLNLTEANEKQKSDWRLEYVMTKAFGLRDLQPKSLLQLGLSFLLPQSKAFDKYFTHFMVDYSSSIVCDGSCKVHQVCAVLYLDQQSYSKCAAGADW
ncbi:hypothetical protein CCH79_00000629 [Gambusia affinis]|uniref:Uncharacterized protein n=1 Tax=Gambusia affinis TaxID=33528 RepID=A0A315W6E2_GAMAF|nr:hypothetical protein CCH79_00000629 [Gambusia affinis]